MILRAENISKSFGSYLVFNQLDISLDASERVALSGRSGAGKTCLIHILAGLDDQFTGRVERFTNSTSVVFQEDGLFPYKTVRENIVYPLYGKPGDRDLYQHWIEVCQLQDFENYYPHQLSRGMKKRVAIIRGFITKPELAFLDEPFAGLDDRMIEDISSHIMKVHDKTAILAASHLALPETFCSRSLRLEQLV